MRLQASCQGCIRPGGGNAAATQEGLALVPGNGTAIPSGHGDGWGAKLIRDVDVAAEPGLLVMDLAAADDDTAFAFQNAIDQRRAKIFLAALWDALGVTHLADHSPDHCDRDTAQALAVPGDLTMAELAGGQIPGHIALTTYRSAKGHEFQIVILPGLVEGLLPRHYLGKPPAPKEVADACRAFYVALTRAKDEAVLIGGNRYTIPANKWYPARPRDTSRSRFVDEVEAHLPGTPR